MILSEKSKYVVLNSTDYYVKNYHADTHQNEKLT
jgi:hypothetical protein